MQVNISLVTHVDININKFLLSLVFLRLEVGSNRIFFGSHRLEIQNLQPRLNPIQKIWARARPDPEKTGSTHPYNMPLADIQKILIVLIQVEFYLYIFDSNQIQDSTFGLWCADCIADEQNLAFEPKLCWSEMHARCESCQTRSLCTEIPKPIIFRFQWA